MASDNPAESIKPEAVLPYCRVILSDLFDPRRGVSITGTQNASGHVEVMLDGATVVVDRKTFAAAVSAFA
jgi:hypothetical protein